MGPETETNIIGSPDPPLLHRGAVPLLPRKSLVPELLGRVRLATLAAIKTSILKSLIINYIISHTLLYLLFQLIRLFSHL